MDESISSVDRARQAIEIGACKYINIKPGRVGGITNSLKINEISEDAGIPVWIGGMLESALGVAICIELATLDNFTYPGDLFPSSRFYSNDLFEPYNEFKLNVSDLHTIHVEQSGNPDGKPVIFLHGGPGGGIEPVYRQYFNPKKWRIIARFALK